MASWQYREPGDEYWVFCTPEEVEEARQRGCEIRDHDEFAIEQAVRDAIAQFGAERFARALAERELAATHLYRITDGVAPVEAQSFDWHQVGNIKPGEALATAEVFKPWLATAQRLGKNIALYVHVPKDADGVDLPDGGQKEMNREPGFIKPDTDTQVFFYEQDFYVLSNFSAFNLRWKGYTFPTSEHAYHWEKFTPNYTALRGELLSAPSAHEAFKMAERNKHCRRLDWDAVKVDVMRDILRTKAAQHEYVRRKLLATGDRELIEDSWRDDFWGWGPNRDGQNMLGKLWMEIRAEIRQTTDGVALPDGAKAK